MPNDVNPLNWQVPIVNKDGTPTNEFMRKWLQQAATNGTIPALNTAAEVSTLLDLIGLAEGEVLFRGDTEWQVLTPGAAGDVLQTQGSAAPVWASASAILDTLGATQGDVLFRDAGGWAVLPGAGTDGYVLTWNATTGKPEWRTVAGGGAIIGVGTPTALEPAGTLYSRSDAAGVYTSTPTTSGAGAAIVQSATQDNNTHASPNQVHFTSNVTPGNLLVAFFFTQDAPLTLGADWTAGPAVNDGSNSAMQVVYRIAQAGDDKAPPAVFTDTPEVSSSWLAWELSNCTWANFDTSVGAGVSNGTLSTVTDPITPSVTDELVLLAAAQFVLSGAAVAVGTEFTLSKKGTYEYTQQWGGYNNTTASGTGISTTITWDDNIASACYIALSINGAGIAPVAGWTLVGPESSDASTILDTLGSTQGDILFRGASTWEVLAPGTAGDVLTSQGASADTKWTTPGLGVIDGSNAAAGIVGEYLSAGFGEAGETAMTSSIPLDITYLDLSAGDWDVWGTAASDAGSVGTSVTDFSGWISSVSATYPATPNKGAMFRISGAALGLTGDEEIFSVSPIRFNVIVATRVYLSARATFSGGSNFAWGYLQARRMR